MDRREHEVGQPMSENVHLSEEQLALLASEEPEPPVAAHLKNCPQCSARWEEYRALRRALRALPSPPLPRDFRFGVRAVAWLRRPPWWWRYRAPLRVATLFAATLLVLLVAGTVYWPPGSSPTAGSSPTGAATPTEVGVLVAEPAGQERTLEKAGTPEFEATLVTPPAEPAVVPPPAAGVEPGRGGEELVTTPHSGTPAIPSISTSAAPSSPARSPSGTAGSEPTAVHESSEFASLWRLGAGVVAVLLAAVTAFGLVFGFVLPLLRGRRIVS